MRRHDLWLAMAILLVQGQPGCNGGGKPLAPAPGAPQYQSPARQAVPGGFVNLAGGNFAVARTDLTLDTRLGTHAIGATYNSASGAWIWNFDVRYDGQTFVDASGSIHDLTNVADGEPVPGTVWRRIGATALKTRGGLRHVFDPETHRLLRVRWSSSPYPRLEYVQADVAGAARTRAVEQCTAPGVCDELFSIDYDGEGRVVRIDDLAGRSADFAYGAGAGPNPIAARDGLDVERGWPGFRYEYAGTNLVAIVNSENERVEIDYQGARATAVRPIGEQHPVHRFRYAKKTGGLYTTVFTDPLGFETTTRYDAERRVHSVRNALDEVSTYTWSGRRPAA